MFEKATDLSCLCWSAPEVLQLLHKYSECVVAYFSGHDHAGGEAKDDMDIQHIAFHGVLENNRNPDFGMCYMYSERIELVGNGRVPSLTLPLRYEIQTSS